MPYIGAGIQKFNTANNLTVSGTSELKNNVTVTGDVTASGTVLPTGDTAAGDAAALGFTSAEGLILTGQGSTSDVVIKNDADATVLSVPTGTTGVTFAGAVTADAGVSIDNITIDGTEIDLSSGDLTIDVAGEIILDADTQGSGNGILLKDAGTLYGSFFRSSSNFHIKAETSDQDMIFMGNDGGSEITALTLDMSDAGAATFSGVIKAADGSESAPAIVFNNDTDTGLYRIGGDKLGFVTGGVERMRITDLGRIEFEVPTNQTGQLQDQRLDWRNENNAGIMASIAVHRESDGNAPAALVFRTSTNVDTASNSSDGDIEERMRITSSGDVLVNTTSLLSDGKVSIAATLTSRTCSTMKNLSTQGSGHTYIRFTNSSNAIAGSIQHTGTTTTSYGTSSDYRLKDNVADMTDAIARVKALAPKRFNFIADADTTVDGFLAHEAQTVVPEAVMGTHNEVETWTQQQIDDGDAPDGTSAGDNKLDGDGNTIPVMQQIDHSKLVPLLTGALREAITKIETLETEMTALKARVTTLEGE